MKRERFTAAVHEAHNRDTRAKANYEQIAWIFGLARIFGLHGSQAEIEEKNQALNTVVTYT